MPPAKFFKDYEPGFVHVDIKYLRQMPDEASRRYLLVAIDRATRWVFVCVYADQSESSSLDFLERLHEAAPMKVTKVLADNGSQLTDRFTSKKLELWPTYNQQTPQPALNHLTPNQALKDCSTKRPDFFRKTGSESPGS